MNEELEKLSIESILLTKDISFSNLETELAKKFNLSSEKLRTMLIEAESVEELLDKLGVNKEV